jgi:hypothetical protein
VSIEKTRDNLISTFIANWATTPVAVDNVRFEPDNAPYVLAQIAPSVSEQPCLGRDSGEAWERDLGDFILQVHVPVNYEGDGMKLAEDARKVVSQQRFNETITDVGYTVPAGVAPNDDRYYVYSVRIPYRTDNLKV